MHPVLAHSIRVFMRLLTLLLVALTTVNCVPRITSDDFVPQSVISRSGNQPYNGTVNVQAMRINSPDNYYVMLKEGVEKTIAKNNLFKDVVQGKADYVLDVWLERIVTQEKIKGSEGCTSDVFSIWRLTRVCDGKVLICDFVNGHSTASNGMYLQLKSFFTATQDMIQVGLKVLADPSGNHLSALSYAGMRPSMGPAVPETFAPWAAKVIQNWPKLRMGLTVDEVEKCIGPVETSGAILQHYTKGYTQEYKTGIYTLWFINGKLSRWKLQEP